MIDAYVRPGYLGARVSYTCEISGVIFAEGFDVSAEQARQQCRHILLIDPKQGVDYFAFEATGAVVTLDAMHCQTETAAAIREQQADYLLTVKKNQPTLWGELLDQFIAYEESGDPARVLRRHTTTEKSHGRQERRAYCVAPAPAHLKEQWKDIQTIGTVYRCREHNGQVQEETIFFISSLPTRVRQLAKHLRGHWGIENSLHWVLDVTFREDDSRIRKGNAPEIASLFRKLALNILQRDTTLKSSLRGKRLQAGWNNNVLEGILAGFNHF